MCVPDIDQLQPYRNDEPIDQAVASLKRRIVLLEAELRCRRELMPGLVYYPRHNILVDSGVVFDDD